MIGYPLAPVVAFLRARGELGALDGAPWIAHSLGGAPYLSALERSDLDDDVEDACLYLGSNDLCPAAEGWVSRVLAMAIGCPLPCHLQDCGSFLCLWLAPPLATTYPRYSWLWVDHDFIADDDRSRLRGPPPPTPAARVAAVLDFELKRSAS